VAQQSRAEIGLHRDDGEISVPVIVRDPLRALGAEPAFCIRHRNRSGARDSGYGSVDTVGKGVLSQSHEVDIW